MGFSIFPHRNWKNWQLNPPKASNMFQVTKTTASLKFTLISTARLQPHFKGVPSVWSSSWATTFLTLHRKVVVVCYFCGGRYSLERWLTLTLTLHLHIHPFFLQGFSSRKFSTRTLLPTVTSASTPSKKTGHQTWESRTYYKWFGAY